MNLFFFCHHLVSKFDFDRRRAMISHNDYSTISRFQMDVSIHYLHIPKSHENLILNSSNMFKLYSILDFHHLEKKKNTFYSHHGETSIVVMSTSKFPAVFSAPPRAAARWPSPRPARRRAAERAGKRGDSGSDGKGLGRSGKGS